MASSTEELLIKIGADISELSSGMREAQEQIKGFGKGVEDSANRGTLTIGKLVGALGLVKVASAGFDMLKNSISTAFSRIDTMEGFDRVMTTLLGSTEDANAALEKTNEIVTGTAYGLDVAAKGVQNFVTRGLDIDKSTGYIEAWGDAVAFYGDGSNEQFANVTDAMAKMVSSGKVGMDQLDRLYDAGIDGPGMYAQATGQSVADVQKALSDGKIGAQEFLDVVTDAMMNGTGGVTKIAGAAKEAGASWGAAFDNMRAAVARGMTSIIENIDMALTSNGLPDMRTMVADFGKAFESALKSAAEKLPDLIANIKNVYETLQPWIPLIAAVSAGIASFVAIMATINTVVSIWKSLKAAVLAANAVMMANPYVLIAAAVIALAVLIYSYWDEIVAFTKAVWSAIVDIAVEFWNSLKSSAVEIWTLIVDAVTSVWESVATFFTDLWSSITETATTAWTAFITALTDIWNSVVEVATSVWNTVKEAIMAVVGPIVENVVTQFNIMKTGLTEIWNGVATYFTGAWEVLKNIFLGAILLIYDLVTGNFTALKSDALAIWENVKSGLATMWSGIKQVFSAALDLIVNVVKNGWNNLKNQTTSVFNTVKSLITSVWNSIKSTLTNAVKNIVNGVKTGWNNLKSNTVSAFNAIRTAITNAWNNIRSFISGLIPSIISTVVNGFNSLKSSVSNAMSNVFSTIRNIWNSIMSFMRGINLADIGRNIIQGLINGITGMAGKIVDAAKGVVNKIPKAIRGVLGIKSPSRVTMALGRYTGQGMIEGLADMRRQMERTAQAAAAWMTPDAPDIPRIADWDIPVAGTGVSAIRTEQRIQHEIAERDENRRKPAYITFELGRNDFEAYVDDIYTTQQRKERLKRKTTKGGRN